MLRSRSLARILPQASLPLCLVAVGLAGCGSSDETKTFDEQGFGITFEYPGDLERTEDVTLSEQSGTAEDNIALAVAEQSAIFIQRYALEQEITDANADDARREIEAVLSRLSGESVEGERFEVGDLPAFRYELDDLATPPKGRSTIVVILDGRNEYFLNCQSVPEGRQELEEACEMALDTLEPTG